MEIRFRTDRAGADLDDWSGMPPDGRRSGRTGSVPSTRSVRLYRTRDREPVPADVNTSAAGDAIVLQPLKMLDAGTKYTFEVTRDLRDTSGGAFLPFVMTFTTGGGSHLGSYPVAFEKISLPGDSEHYTCLAVGPDHRLYGSTVDGKIIRSEIRADGMLANAQLISTITERNAGPRLITGIRFDPAATKENLVLWVSHGQYLANSRGGFALEGASDWTGKITRLAGPDLGESRDVVINLPRSWRDHLNNQLDFGPDGALYFSQASHTAMGAPDAKWGRRTERLLSAAILRVDVSKIPGTLDVKTNEGGYYDPFAPGAPLTIYASGVRVGYDMLWHSNGSLYTAVNGSAAGGNTPGTPSGPVPRRIDDDRLGRYIGPEVPGLSVSETQPDLLLKIDPGGYYGHPNPIRGEYVLNGGNPTAEPDLLEVSAYPTGTHPDRNWRLPAYVFGKSVSPNGLLEYKGSAFGGLLNGKILVTRFSGGKDILILTPGKIGEIVESISGIAGFGRFTDPLDLTEDPLTGFLYVAEFGGQKLALLRPITDPKAAVQLSHNVFRQDVSPLR